LKKGKNMKVSIETLTVAAFRYALGRSTYIVGSVIDDIMNNINNIPKPHLRRMAQEIIEAKKENRLGMKMDEEAWFKLLEEINKRL
jgi:hypothetical protein